MYLCLAKLSDLICVSANDTSRTAELCYRSYTFEFFIMNEHRKVRTLGGSCEPGNARKNEDSPESTCGCHQLAKITIMRILQYITI